MTVTGLAPGQTATVTVTATRSGFPDGSATQAGTALDALPPDTPSPSPTGTAPPTQVQVQVPVRPLRLPAHLNPTGWTRLVRLPVRTNAGQTARVRITCRPGPASALAPAALPAGDDQPSCRVRRGPHHAAVWVSGTRPVTVRVTITAPAAPGYTALRRMRIYRTEQIRLDPAPPRGLRTGTAA